MLSYAAAIEEHRTLSRAALRLDLGLRFQHRPILHFAR